MHNEIKISSDFFPESIRLSLVQEIEDMGVRKREFHLSAGENVPECVISAARFASDKLGLEFNFAVLKRYRVTDLYESQAYEMHLDPDNLTSIPLVLCTLEGEADLIYISGSGAETTVRCSRNVVVLLDSALKHRVTPPSSASGERHFLFLGYDTYQ